MQFRLEVVEGPDQGRTLVYSGSGPLVLGRDGAADDDLQRLTDPSVSREHCVIHPRDGEAVLTAVKGCNPLRVGDVATCRARLRSGDVFGLGRTRIRLRLDRESPRAKGPPDASRRLPRRRIDEFVLGDEIGRGSLGKVMEAVDLASGERVAVKLFQPSLGEMGAVVGEDDPLWERAVGYFLREVDIGSVLDHPNLARALGVGRDPDRLFLVMELIEGATLSETVSVSGPLDLSACVELSRGMLAALQHAHDLGVVHRDVCPSNVMLEECESGWCPRLLDFGLAKDFLTERHRSLTITGEGRGQILYMAPECASDAKHAGPAADIFGVGASLYFALTGEACFGAASGERSLLDAVRGGKVVPLDERAPHVPAWLDRVVARALRSKPEERWPSARAMWQAIEGGADGL